MKKTISQKKITTHGMVFFLLVILSGWYGCTKKDFRVVPVASITSLNDTLFNVGDTMRINGNNFDADNSKNLVSLSSVSLKVISSSPTLIKAVITPLARTGQLSIAFSEGRSASYTGVVHVITPGEPFVRTIVPSSVSSGDTVLISGKNFGTPFNLNGVTIGGAQATIFNATDTLLKIVIPPNASTGDAIVTSSGLTSSPYHVTVTRSNPLADGRLYWLMPYRSVANQTLPTYNYLYQGADQNAGPNATKIGVLNNDEVIQAGTGTGSPQTIYDLNGKPRGFLASNIVTDANGNIYSLYYTATNTTLGTASLVKMQYKPTYSRTVLWTQAFTTANAGTSIFTNGAAKTFSIPTFPCTRLSIDGNKVYIKMGMSNNFYVADISQPMVTPVLQTYNLPDAQSYGLEFSTNYVFYGIAGSFNASATTPSQIIGLRYVPRGGTVSKAIPLDPTINIIAYMTDPSHQDNLLIYTNVNIFNGKLINGFTGAIYKFNATTNVLTKLYDQNNWIDALSSKDVSSSGQFEEYNKGFVWVNDHIYYSNKRRYVNGVQTTGMYMLNDDGSSRKPVTIYAQIDVDFPGANYNSFTQLFIDKTQAKP